MNETSTITKRVPTADVVVETLPENHTRSFRQEGEFEFETRLTKTCASTQRLLNYFKSYVYLSMSAHSNVLLFANRVSHSHYTSFRFLCSGW